MPEVLAKRGVIPGIRLDKGAEVFAQFVSKRSLKDLMTVRVRRFFFVLPASRIPVTASTTK
jgi:hypothetical protein